MHQLFEVLVKDEVSGLCQSLYWTVGPYLYTDLKQSLFQLQRNPPPQD